MWLLLYQEINVLYYSTAYWQIWFELSRVKCISNNQRRETKLLSVSRRFDLRSVTSLLTVNVWKSWGNWFLSLCKVPVSQNLSFRELTIYRTLGQYTANHDFFWPTPPTQSLTIFCGFVCISQELQQELQALLDRSKIKEKDARYGLLVIYFCTYYSWAILLSKRCS